MSFKAKKQASIMRAEAADMPALTRIHFSAMDARLGDRMTDPPMADDPAAQAAFAAHSARELEGNPAARYWKAVMRDAEAESETAATQDGGGKQKSQDGKGAREPGEEQETRDVGEWKAVGFAKWLVWEHGQTPEQAEASFRLSAAPPTARQPAWDEVFGFVARSRRQHVGTARFAGERPILPQTTVLRTRD
jgi:hypothetical protein